MCPAIATVLNAAELIGLLPKVGDDHRGRQKMQTAAKSSFALIENFSLDLEMLIRLQKANRQAEFYQQITRAIIKGVHTKESLTRLGQRLTNLAQYAYASRQMDIVEQVSQVLMNLPLGREIRNIARYYQAFCIKRRGHFSEAHRLFERVADEDSPRYRTRAIIALGSIAFDSGKFQSALSLYVEGNRAMMRSREFDPLAAFYAWHMLAVLKSIDGDHSGALADLERMLPLVRVVGSSYPSLYCNYLNSLAIEIAEAGRVEEAQNVCRIMLASPYASAYPEMRETWDEVQLRGYHMSRSVVSVTQKIRPQNLFHLPERERTEKFRRNPFHQPREVTKLEDWRKKMVKEPNGTPHDDKPSKKLDDREKMLRIIQLVSEPERTDKELEIILEAVEKIVSKPKGKGGQ